MKKIMSIVIIGFLLVSGAGILVQARDSIYDCGCNDGLIISDLSEINNRFPSSVDFSNEDFPDYFNWRDYEDKDWTTSVKNQFVPQRCGACWVFSALGALESIIKIREGCPSMYPDLSEQYILSCLPAAAGKHSKGCQGGDPTNAYKYIMSTTEDGNFHNGVIWESCFPYQAKDLSQGVTCDQKCSNWLDYLVPISDYGRITNEGVLENTPESIEIIKNIVMQNGPTVAGMNTNLNFAIWGFTHHSPEDYFPYDGGVWTNSLNHAIVIVGWKDDPSINNGGYWICKNTIGTSFANNGFFNIEYAARFTGAILIWVDYDPESFDWPPNTPAISGPANVKPEEEYEYTFTSMDPDGDDDVFYYIDWRDDTNSEWIGPYESNEIVTINHTWENKGTYNIRAKAKGPSGLESDWGTLKVAVPRNIISINTIIQRLFEWFPNIFPMLRLLFQCLD